MKLTTRQLKKLIKEELDSIRSAVDLRAILLKRLQDPNFLSGWDVAEATAALNLFDMLNKLSTMGSKAALMNKIIEKANQLAGEALKEPEEPPKDPTDKEAERRKAK
jgi:hypothetical protein